MSAGVTNTPVLTASCLVGGLGIATFDKAKFINVAAVVYTGDTSKDVAGFGGGGFGLATTPHGRHSFGPLFAGGDLLWIPPEPEPLDVIVPNMAFPLWVARSGIWKVTVLVSAGTIW